MKTVAGAARALMSTSARSMYVLAAIAMVPSAALAQSAAVTDDPDAIEAVVVTGTRIVRDGYDAPTPTSVIGAAELTAAAPANIADFVNRLPSLAGSSTPRNQTANVSAGTTGINALSLRALGGARTLVLLDGQRVPPSTLSGLVDINGLPNALVSRVDVVTGGASAAWGSDAVAGVVNFVLDKEFTGLKGEAQAGVTTYGDDRSYKLSLTGGADFAGGRGHAIASAESSLVSGITGLPRDWYTGAKTLFNPAYTATNGQPQLLIRQGAGYSTAAPGAIVTAGPLRGLYFGPNGVPAQLNYGSIVSDPQMVGGDWRYTDFGRTGDLDPRISHQSFFGRVSYDLTDSVEAYGQFSYGRARTSQLSTPQFNFGNLTIQRDNAFLPADVVARMTALGETSLRVGSWNQDLGVIPTVSNRSQYRYLGGLAGRFTFLDKEWSWDAYAQRSIGHVYNSAEVSITANYNRAIDAVRGPNGSIVCRSTLTNPNNGCVPYNLLGTGTASEAAKDYVLGLAWLKNRLVQDVAAASVNGEPFSVWAGPVSLAAGVEYRRESVTSDNDPLSTASSYFAGNYKQTRGAYEVVEGFAEVVVPLAKDVAWADSLDVNAAVRATDYSVSGYVTTWKVGVTYAPIEDIKFRVTRSRDIRAPNLAELFQANATVTNTIPDPFRNNVSTVFFQVTSGNTALKPEKADTLGIGVIVQPRILPGFSASVDYYNIDIAGAITSINAATLLNNCFAGNEALCPQIIRDGNGVITQVLVQPLNLSKQIARGIDFEASYRTNLDVIRPEWDGSLTLRLLATRYLKNYLNNGINVPTDTVGSNTAGPPRWRFLAIAAYDNGPASIALTARGLSDGVYNTSYIECASSCPTSTTANMTIDNNRIDGALYFDAALSYDFTERLEAFVTIDNIANKDPAVAAGGTSIGGANPGVNATFYDTLGRTFRAGVRFRM